MFYYSRASEKPTTWRPNHLQNNIGPWGQNTLGTCRCRYNDAKFSTKIAKGGPVRHTKSKCAASCSLPLNQRGQSGRLTTGGGERTPQMPRLYLAESATPAQKTVDQGSKGGSRRLARRDGPLERLPEGVLPPGDPRSRAQTLRVALVTQH